ncbi:MAG: Mth938-like domain-containing protein [Woeseiaceae bacterium]
MKFTLESIAAASIRSVANGQFVIGDQSWSEPIALTAEGMVDNWSIVPVDLLSIEALEPLLERQPELIVVGTGSQQLLPERDLMFAMARSGVGLELMDTPAAARTFNVLIGEGRSVAAVLYPTDIT